MIPALKKELAKHGAEPFTTQNGFDVRLPGGHVAGTFPMCPDVIEIDDIGSDRVPTQTKTAVRAIAGFAEILNASQAIEKDGRLTELGRSEKLAPLRERFVRDLAYQHAELDRVTKNIAEQESTRYAIPVLAKDDVPGHLWELERFRMLRSMSKDERLQLMKALTVGEENELGHTIMRQRMKFPEPVADVAANAWRQQIDARDPQGRQFLDLGNAMNDWAARTLAQVRGMARNQIGAVPRARLFEITKDLNGAKHFGFSDNEIFTIQRRAARG